jgi:glycosyltransferase involved in cell wall biosynthesis
VVVLEALARAIPVVTTDAFVPEIVEDEVTARVVPAERPDALAAAISELIADRELAQRLGSRGRERVRQEATPEAATAELRSLFA